LYHPRRDRWDSHFAWREDSTLLVGLTPAGRATVEVLHLYRAGVVILRRLLIWVASTGNATLRTLRATNRNGGERGWAWGRAHLACATCRCGLPMQSNTPHQAPDISRHSTTLRAHDHGYT
jgi:hypothetical protein